MQASISSVIARIRLCAFMVVCPEKPICFTIPFCFAYSIKSKTPLSIRPSTSASESMECINHKSSVSVFIRFREPVRCSSASFLVLARVLVIKNISSRYFGFQNFPNLISASPSKYDSALSKKRIPL